MKIHNSVKITAVTMNFAVKITSPFPYLSLKSTAGAFRYFSVHDKMKFHDLLSFCYHSQRWNFEAEQRQYTAGPTQSITLFATEWLWQSLAYLAVIKTCRQNGENIFLLFQEEQVRLKFTSHVTDKDC